MSSSPYTSSQLQDKKKDDALSHTRHLDNAKTNSFRGRRPKTFYHGNRTRFNGREAHTGDPSYVILRKILAQGGYNEFICSLELIVSCQVLT